MGTIVFYGAIPIELQKASKEQLRNQTQSVPLMSTCLMRYCIMHDSVLFDSVLLDSDLLIQYCLIQISWFGTNLIRNGWFGICYCYVLTLRWNSWRHRCAHSTNLLIPIEIHWAQWSCSCYTSLLRSPGRSLLECRDALCVPRALLLGCSKMQGCQPIYANGYFTTRTVSSSLVLNLSLMSQTN